MKKTREEQIAHLKSLKDKDIDYSDIPDISSSKNWKRLYPDATKDTIITDKMMFEALAKVLHEDEPDKVPVTIKLDRKVVDFFKEHSKKYQVKINEVLMAFVQTYEESHPHHRKKAS